MVSLGAVSVGAVVLIGLPETMKIKPETASQTSDTQSDQDDSTDEQPATQEPSIWSNYHFLRNPNLIILLSIFCLYWIGRCQLDLLTQYISVRYDQPIARAGMVFPLNAIISLVAVFVILPLLGRYLQAKFHLPSPTKDLYLAKGSILLLGIGCLVIGLSPSLVIMLLGDAVYISGTGFTALARSLLTVYVDKTHAGRLQAVASVVQMLGLLVGAPVLALLFDWGLSMGVEWSSLPFLGTSMLHFSCSVATWRITVPSEGKTHQSTL